MLLNNYNHGYTNLDESLVELDILLLHEEIEYENIIRQCLLEEHDMLINESSNSAKKDNIFKRLWEGLKKLVSNAIKWIKGVWNKMFGKNKKADLSKKMKDEIIRKTRIRMNDLNKTESKIVNESNLTLASFKNDPKYIKLQDKFSKILKNLYETKIHTISEQYDDIEKLLNEFYQSDDIEAAKNNWNNITMFLKTGLKKQKISDISEIMNADSKEYLNSLNPNNINDDVIDVIGDLIIQKYPDILSEYRVSFIQFLSYGYVYKYLKYLYGNSEELDKMGISTVIEYTMDTSIPKLRDKLDDSENTDQLTRIKKDLTLLTYQTQRLVEFREIIFDIHEQDLKSIHSNGLGNI